MWLWWHFSNDDNSTPVLLIKCGLVAKIRSIQEGYPLVIWVGWLIIWLQPQIDVKELISRPSAFSLSKLQHFEDLALKSPVITYSGMFRSLN